MIAVPGLNPRSPLRLLGPVLVTVDPPSTEYVATVPNTTGSSAASDGDGTDISPTNNSVLPAATSPPTALHRVLCAPWTRSRSFERPSAMAIPSDCARGIAGIQCRKKLGDSSTRDGHLFLLST